MKQILSLIITFLSIQTCAQLYKNSKGWKVYFAEIKNDSAHVEIYYNTPPDFVIEDFNKVIPLNDTNFDKTVELSIWRRNHPLKLSIQSGKRPKKIYLVPCETVDRSIYRNESYSSHKRIQMMKFQDSLSGPDIFIPLDVNNTYRKVNTNLSETDYKEIIEKITDSLKMEICHLKNPIIDLYFQKADSVSNLDTLALYDLLSNANYKFQFGKYLLYKVAIERPELLINYIDTDPRNNDLVLRAIRNHDNYREITKKVKDTELSSTGKKKIVNQKSKRIITDIGVGTAYVTIILSELAALTAIGIWIF